MAAVGGGPSAAERDRWRLAEAARVWRVPPDAEASMAAGEEGRQRPAKPAGSQCAGPRTPASLTCLRGLLPPPPQPRQPRRDTPGDPRHVAPA